MKENRKSVAGATSRAKHLLAEVAALNPIQDDRNEEVCWWCAFCEEEAKDKNVTHKADCLWVRIRDHVSENAAGQVLTNQKGGMSC